MALYKLLLPKMGESVAEATIIKWNKAIGDRVEMDDTVMEIATDKVDSEVPSPVSGKLIEQLCKEEEVVQVGSVIAVIETEEPANYIQNGTAPAEEIIALAETDAKKENDAHKSNEVGGSAAEQPNPVVAYSAVVKEDASFPETLSLPGIDQLPAGTPVAQTSGNRFYSPLVRNIATQEKVSAAELDAIPGSGADGRLTKDDLLNYINNRNNMPPAPAIAEEVPVAEPAGATVQEPVEAPVKPEVKEPQPAPVKAAPVAPKPDAPAMAPSQSLSGGDEIIEMDRMRRLIADHMVMSVHTSPHVTSFVEADVTNLVAWRENIKDAFEQREGTKITFTPIFIEAVARAIKDMPLINVSVNGTQIIKKKDINIGMATALPSGNLIVPVIRKADELNLIGLSKAVNDLSSRARLNKLQPGEVKDGTFTITNVGSFGNVMGTPIINQPQVAILAVGAIKKKPAVIETPEGDVIAIRHMMFLSLSYDHRVVDGALGGSFVRRVADYLEAWDINRSF
ncbi:dihydrolipoamide acetyltransferase family protein [Mucilaginibacter paludis]|uniref:Dihydrolipoamide acetyltransferase component of pyruvate dehydrogenase complex n=1 Tax=Mucilaginibacter paludis DSM 18603 TaxID=714943 RepID=H1Y3E0_9SPHI|nr:dihydrolipoamide acetyltransferase family protein [Mucilaginibacter paludis]EHQ29295.1 catalytic domain-containing protein of component of various dehydrogenase complexes [Mucilaginibacter paludis DSM 18603]